MKLSLSLLTELTMSGARKFYEITNLDKKNPILFSPVFKKLKLKDLTEWILSDNLPVRLNTQLHKYIWDPKTIGV